MPAVSLGLPIILFFTPSIKASEDQVQPQHVIKWATIAPENSFWGDIIHTVAREIEELSQGRIKNIWYFGAVMGDEPDMIRKANLDQLQGLALISVGLCKLAPELMAFSLPFLYQNYQEVDCVFDRSWNMIRKILARKGYVVLGRADAGFSVFFSKHDLRSREDFQKARAWAWAGLEYDKIGYEFYGCKTLIPLPVQEVHGGLETGLIDMVYGSHYFAIAMQWFNQVKYMSDITQNPGAYSPAMTILKAEIYNSLPPDLQQIVKGSMNKYVDYLRRELRKTEENARLALIKQGIKLSRMDPEFLQSIKEQTENNYHRWQKASSIPDWLLQDVISARDQCRADLAQ